MRKNKNNSPPERLNILFADDEVQLQELIREEIPRMGHRVTVCPDGLTAIAAAELNHYDCLLVDLDMPGMHGIEVIARVRELSPTCEAIVLTGKGSTETAIAALRYGVFDYLLKPCKLSELRSLLARVEEKRQLTKKCRALELRLERWEGQSQMIGRHPAMEAIKQLIARVAPTASTVLVAGETGTGKELVARSVHLQSDRADQPFVAINCAALPENLIESELFGHRKGAFTGADQSRTGLFEVANGGTLFLDEIGELPKTMQSKLLRVLESGEVRRIGDNEPFEVDVRIVAATNRDLAQMVRDDLFREDLMYRINTFEIRLPPLRERPSDIPELAEHLLRRFRADAAARSQVLTPAALEHLRRHRWPGNIRELANALERAAILCDELPVDVAHLPTWLVGPTFVGPAANGQPKDWLAGKSLREIEYAAIDAALERHQGNKIAATEELGISVKTLYNRLNELEAHRRAA